MSYPVVLCIGTDKVQGDSLGPRVGRLLKHFFRAKAFVYGDLANPVTALNFDEYRRHIEHVHKGSLLIAVDACLGRAENVGTITVSTSGLTAGGAFNKGLKTVGDLAFLGVVGQASEDNLAALTQADPPLVASLALQIAAKIVKVLKNTAFIENL